MTENNMFELNEKYLAFTEKKITIILFLLPVILFAAGIAASLGSANISVGEACTAFLHRFFPNYFASDWLAQTCVWDLRLPRILMAILAGTGLGVAGCIVQGVLRNPLASPYTLGISSGSGFGASLAILAGNGIAGGQYLVIGSAFIFALISSSIIIGIANRRGASPETMILAGIAMTCLFGSATTILQYFGDAEAVKEAVFWMVGDLGRASWEKLSIVSVVLAVCLPLLFWKTWDLNVIGGGDESAHSLGINVKRTRIFLMTVSTLMVAGVVCFTGTIGFIGLVAPHIVRMVIGGDNRFLVPASGLLGAILLLVSDTVARRILAPVILPVGTLTAFLGVPLFLYLIMRKRRDYF